MSVSASLGLVECHWNRSVLFHYCLGLDCRSVLMLVRRSQSRQNALVREKLGCSLGGVVFDPACFLPVGIDLGSTDLGGSRIARKGACYSSGWGNSELWWERGAK